MTLSFVTQAIDEGRLTLTLKIDLGRFENSHLNKGQWIRITTFCYMYHTPIYDQSDESDPKLTAETNDVTATKTDLPFLTIPFTSATPRDFHIYAFRATHRITFRFT